MQNFIKTHISYMWPTMRHYPSHTNSQKTVCLQFCVEIHAWNCILNQDMSLVKSTGLIYLHPQYYSLILLIIFVKLPTYESFISAYNRSNSCKISLRHIFHICDLPWDTTHLILIAKKLFVFSFVSKSMHDRVYFRRTWA